MLSAEQRRIPVDYYVSDERFARERELIFRSCWLNVGRTEEIARPGDFITREVHILRASIIISRDRDGQIHAFHNVCSHRGSPVCTAKRGNTSMFVCPFHAWTYSLDGSLRRVPEQECYGTLETQRLGLTRVHVDQWEGFIFVNFAAEPKETLPEFLGTLPSLLSGYPFGEAAQADYRYSIELNANWKLVRDAFVEGHHVRTVHAKTIADQFVSEHNPYSHTMLLATRGRHGYMSLDSNPLFQPTATEMIGVRRGMRRMEFADGLPAGLNQTRNDKWVMDVNSIFPNFFVDLIDGWMLTYRFLPVTVGKTLWEIDMYFPAPRNASERFYHESTLVRSRDALAEDVAVVERIHTAFLSGAKSEINLHDEEMLIWHGYETADEYMRVAAHV